MKRAITILFILAVVVGGSVAGYQYLTPAMSQELNDDPNVEVVQIGRETLVDTVNATGSIEPESEVEMKFEIGGVVKEVLVKRGQYVTAGTVLARLATGDLELEIRRAEIELAQVKAELDQLFEPELAEKIAASRAKVESARLKLADLQDGPDPDEVTKAEAELRRKQIALKTAQWEYDQVAYRGDVGAMPQADKLQEATLDYEAAQADYNLAVKEATPADLADARSTLADAQSSLAELLKEPSAAEIAAKQAAVDKAQLTLEEKQRDLEQAVLTSPTDGVILEVNIEPGERVLDDAGDAALIIANTSTYLLKMEVDEIDIGRIRQGQPAEVSLDAFAEQSFAGVVTDIAPRPVEKEGDSIVTYEVTITLDPSGQPLSLLTGMTASASIETRQLKDVVVVPNRAIQIDRAGSEPVVFVEKVDGQGQTTRVEVELGSRNGKVTEVVAGLKEGDQVIIRKQATVGVESSL
ncbi:MAG: efflux RND transporter periplasmic adaptor subunit [Anaerolineales bacterium]|nr:efflux RND transporter periplasmic adaptor subunit [Anaerolineales bacterium]